MKPLIIACAACVLLLPGCHHPGSVCNNRYQSPAATTAPVGELSQLRFAYNSVVGIDPASTSVAVGAKVGIFIESLDGSLLTSGTLRTQDPAIATVTPAVPPQVHGISAGSTRLEVVDAAGTVIDRAPITVAAVDRIVFAAGWGSQPGPTVATGVTERYWVQLEHAGALLAGSGATHFTYTGSLAPGLESNAPQESLPDTEENFAVGTAAGAATITAQSGTATATLPVTLVGVETITAAGVAMGAPDYQLGCVDHLEVTALVGQTAVYGPPCAWTAPPGVVLSDDRARQYGDAGGWTGDAPARRYLVTATAPGPYRVSCRLTPTVALDVDLTIEPR